MSNKFSIAAAFMLMSSVAMAESAEKASSVTTDAQGKTLIGAPLSYNPAAEGGNEGKPDTLFVLETGSVKSTAEWSEADSKACKDSGGIELPVSAGRVGCFAL